jgi:hypothetical protein
MSNLGNLYFDVLLKYNDNGAATKMKQELASLERAAAATAQAFSGTLGASIKKTFDLGGLNKQEISELRAKTAAYRQMGNSMAQQQTIAQKAALEEQKLATERERTRLATTRNAIAEQRLGEARTRLATTTRKAEQSNSIFRTSIGIGNNGISVFGKLTSLAGRYVSIFAAGRLLSSLVRIRGEFDMQYVSLKAILQSGQQATTLFQQLQELAVKSPFQFQQLTTYAKMLSAYQIPSQELFGTTKRLADLSSGLGVDMYRVILAYGQVRSAAVLRGQELRQFTEAGIPMVQKLADKFTELKGRVVSTGEVFKLISERQVPFEMVKNVIDDMTKSGGKFYEMQEKQADTLKGKVSNLVDSYQIMMNKIGMKSDGVLKGGVDALTSMMMNYDRLIKVLLDVGVAYSGYRIWIKTLGTMRGAETRSILASTVAERKHQIALLKTESVIRTLTDQEKALIASRGKMNMAAYMKLASSGKIDASQALGLYLSGAKGMTSQTFTSVANKLGMDKGLVSNVTNATKMQKVYMSLLLSMKQLDAASAASIMKSGKLVGAFKTIGYAGVAAFQSIKAAMASIWPFLLISAIMDIVTSLSQANEEAQAFSKAISDTAKETADEIRDFRKEYGEIEIKFKLGKMSSDELDDYIAKLKDEINKLTGAYYDILSGMPADTSKQAQVQWLLNTMQDINKAAYQVKQADISIPQGWGAIMDWISDAMTPNSSHTLGGLITNLKDYSEAFKTVKKDAYEAGMSVTDFMYNVGGKLVGWQKGDTNGLKKASEDVQKNIDDIAAQIKEQFVRGNIVSDQEKAALVQSVYDNILSQNPNIGEEAKIELKVELEKRTLGETKTAYSLLMDELDDKWYNLFQSFDGNWNATQKKAALSAINSIRGQHPELVDECNQIAYDIQNGQLGNITAWIHLRLVNEIPDSTYQTLVKGVLNVGMNRPGMNLSNDYLNGNYSNVLAIAKNASSYTGLVGSLRQEFKTQDEELKGNLKQLNNTPAQFMAYRSSLRKSIDIARTNRDAAARVLSLMNEPTSEEKKAAKSSRGSHAGSTVDLITQNLRKKYLLLKNAVEEYEKLTKTVSRDKAIEMLKKMSGFESINDQQYSEFFNEKGQSALDKAYLDLVKGRKTKEGKSFTEELTKDLQDKQNAEAIDKLTKALDKISDSLKLAKENFEMYDEIMKHTGDDAFATLMAFGKFGKMYDDISSQEIAGFNQEASMTVGQDMTYELVLGMSKDDFDKLPEKLKKDFESVRDVVKGERKKIIEQMADAYENQMTTDQKIEKLDAEKWLALGKAKKILMEKGVSENDVYTNPYYIALMKQFDDELEKLNEDAAKASETWKNVMKDISEMGYNRLGKHLDWLNSLLTGATKNGKDWTLGDGTKVSDSMYKEIVKAVDKVDKKLNSGNPFRKLRKAMSGKETDDEGGKLSLVERMQEVVDACDDIWKGAKEALSAVSALFSSIGNEDVAAGVDEAMALGDAAMTAAQGVAELANGNPMGAFKAVQGVLQGITTIFQSHDKAMDRIIKASQLRVTLIKNLQTDIERLINRSLGGAYTLDISSQVEKDRASLGKLEMAYRLYTATGNKMFKSQYDEYVLTQKRVSAYDSGGKGATYEYEQALLIQQRAELTKQRDAEASKKNGDKNAIADYNAQLDEINDKIRYFSEDTLKELLGIDLKDWASQIGDALVDAFASGESAAKAFDDTIGSLMKSVVKKMASLYILEPMFEKLRVYLFGTDEQNGNGGAFGTDKYLSPEELAAMMPYIMNIKGGISDSKSLYDTIDEYLKKYGIDMSGDSASGLSGSIKSITEDTADLLASYLNAIRADVSVIRSLEQSLNALGGSFTAGTQAQIMQMQQISANTLRNAESCERIENIFNSVVAVSTAGKKIRV